MMLILLVEQIEAYVGHAKRVSSATPEEMAEAGLNAFVKGKSYHVHGRTNYLTSLLPRILSRAAVIGIVAGMFKNRVAPWPA